MDQVIWIGILAVLVILDRMLRMRFPRFWRRLQLPMNLLFTVLCMVFIFLQVTAVQQTLVSDLSTSDKLAPVCVSLVAVAVFGYLLATTWRQWQRTRREE